MLPSTDNDSDALPSKTQTTIAEAGSSTTETSPPTELHQITDGKKRIKINFLTREQKQAKLKAEEEKSASACIPTPKEQPSFDAQPPLPNDNILKLQEVTLLNAQESFASNNSMPAPAGETLLNAQPLSPREEAPLNTQPPPPPIWVYTVLEEKRL